MNQWDLIVDFITGDLRGGESASHLHAKRENGVMGLFSYSEPIAARIVTERGVELAVDDGTNYSITTTQQQSSVRNIARQASVGLIHGDMRQIGSKWTRTDEIHVQGTYTVRKATRSELRELFGMTDEPPAIEKRGRQTFDRATGQRLRRKGW